MLKSRRHLQIQRLLRTHGECSVEFLAGELNVSEMTIRRDLTELAAGDRVVRSHGGAAPTGQVLFEFPFLRESEQNHLEKEAIALAASRLIEDGQSVVLDSGTTTLSLARRLARRKRLVVITTSLPIAAVLQQSSGVETILLGGVLQRHTPDLIGPLTEANLGALHADLAFIGADAIGLDGAMYNASLAVSQMLAKMISRSSAAYVVADSSKVGRTALSQFGNAAQIQGLITDAGLAAQDRQRLEQAGVKVIVAEPLNSTLDDELATDTALTPTDLTPTDEDA